MANRAFLPAVLLWATMTPALYKFAHYCDIRYGSAVRQMPLETAAAAPKAKVDPALYLAPALRCDSITGFSCSVVKLRTRSASVPDLNMMLGAGPDARAGTLNVARLGRTGARLFTPGKSAVGFGGLLHSGTLIATYTHRTML